ncbi:peptidase S8 [Chaetoceros tenuissimus]|uniref:subtilisin n=1 Tax=Chaetoceros tenuissimus TaxID=426638 RepID=A0AAD3CE42_9STRA|nr:peptidase S8 [Chaetoceros tenuissimus]
MKLSNTTFAALLLLSSASSSFLVQAINYEQRSLDILKDIYIVTFNNKEARQTFLESNFSGSLREVFSRGNSISISLTSAEYTELENNALVSNIEINQIIQIDPFAPTQIDMSQNIPDDMASINPLEVPYGINLVNALNVSDEFVGDMTVCVCDTGFDLGHPDLQIDKVDGMSFVNETWSIDGNSHGEVNSCHWHYCCYSK